MGWAPRARAILVATAVVAVAGCGSGSGLELFVDLRTDLRPELEVASVRTTVVVPGTGMVEAERVQSLSLSDDLLSGVRIAELSGLGGGSKSVRVGLRDADGVLVAARTIRVHLEQDRVLRVVITSSCVDRECPGAGDEPQDTECLAGRCVPPECVDIGSEPCVSAECEADADCPSASDCAEPRCDEGVCVGVPDDAMCAEDELCSVSDGCRPSPGTSVCASCAGGGECAGSLLRCAELADGSRACLPLCETGVSTCPGGLECTLDDALEMELCKPVSGPCCVDEDGDGFGRGIDCMGGDCDDGDATVSPGASEACNGVDDDCDGTIDEGDDAELCPPGDGVATSACTSGACVIVSCTAELGDCDGDAANGCERSLDTESDCGSCDNACPASMPACIDGGDGFACTSVCGDGACTAGETAASCAEDCSSVCGDGACTGSENECVCPSDCDSTTCGDGCCGATESACTCAADCGDGAFFDAYVKASSTDGGDELGEGIAVDGDTMVVGAPLEDSAATGVDGDSTDDSAADAGAAYVLVRSGGTWTQQAYLKASNTDDMDNFGQAVAVDGDTIVVGAPGEASGARGVGADETDDSADGAGAVYVFVRSGGTWSQQAYVKASNTDAGDAFGGDVAIDGDTIIAGARWEDGGTTGVDGDGSDDSADTAGAAYVFVRSGGTWSQQAYLKASNTDSGDQFGWDVDVDVDTAVVSARWEDSAATGVDGDQTDNTAGDSGAAYVFVRSGGTWSQQAYLKASNTGGNDRFGRGASVDGDTVVVGAPREQSAATGVDGDDTDDSADEAGAAYVFVRSGGTWSQQAYVKASNTDAFDQLGADTALSGDTLVVSARGEDSAASGVDGSQIDDTLGNAGAAYVLLRSGGVWSHHAYLKASTPGDSDFFGHSVAVSGDTVVVGADGEDSAATGVDGDDTDDTAAEAGAAYVYCGI